MADITSFVNVSITKQTKAITRAGFGTLLFIGNHKIFNDRTKQYINTTDMLTDGFESTDPEYLAATAFFAQNPNQNKILIGRQQSDSAGISIDTVVDNTDYSVVINGTTLTFNSGAGASAVSIAAGLVAAIDGGAEPVDAVDDLDGTFVVNPDVAGVPFTITAVGVNLSVEKPLTATETLLAAYTAIKATNVEFYGVSVYTRVQADVEAIAGQVLTERRLFGTASSDANILDSGVTTDVASVLKTNNNERAFVMYHHLPTTYPEVAWFSKQLSTNPGSSTWQFKNLLGIAASSLSNTDSTDVLNKNGNTYETSGGVDITVGGTTASGEYIDLVRGVDWLQARMTERIFSRLVNSPKIPYTNAGVAIIEGEIRAQLDEGISQSLLASDPAYIITVPLVKDVSANDKTNRLLPSITFEATPAGAIHKITISGSIEV